MILLQELDKIYFFMKRDMRSFSTYKTNIILSVLSALFGALSYAFLGSNAQMQSVLNSYHIDFTTYLIIGIAFNTYLSQSLTLVQKTINPWSLEEVLVSPTGLVTFIIGSSAWGFIWSTLVIAIYLSVGVFAFGVILSINIIGTMLVVALGISTRRNLDSNQTRRPHNNWHNNSHKPFRKCALPTSSHAPSTTANLILCSPILLLHSHQTSTNWSNPVDDSA
jgi:uncharacterized protein YacL